MSELLIDHPITIIDDLLKLRLGDEGRLLYLRKAITNGKLIHESDRKFLKKMEEKIRKIKSEKIKSQLRPHFSANQKVSDIKNPFSDIKYKNPTLTIKPDFEFEINQLKNSILEVKNYNSKIRDNLELVIINREMLTQLTIEKSNSFSNLTKTHTSELFDLIKDNDNYKHLSFFGMKKHDAMTFVSAGIFSLWFAGYQNVIDLGSLQGLTLGFSAGAAVSAALFYNKYRKSRKSIFKSKNLQ